MANVISPRVQETIKNIKTNGFSKVYKTDPELVSGDVTELIDNYLNLVESVKKIAAETKNLRLENAELKEQQKSFSEREICVSRALTDAYATADRLKAEAEAKADKIMEEAENKAQSYLSEIRSQGDSILLEERAEKEKTLLDLETAEQKTARRIAASNAQIRAVQAKSALIVSELAMLSSRFSELTISVNGEPKTIDTLNVTFSSVTASGENEPRTVSEQQSFEIISEKAKEISDFIKRNTQELPKITEEIVEEIDIAETAPKPPIVAATAPRVVVPDEIISDISEFESQAASVNDTRVMPVVKDGDEERPSYFSPVRITNAEPPAWKKSVTEKRDFGDLRFGGNL